MVQSLRRTSKPLSAVQRYALSALSVLGALALALLLERLRLRNISPFLLAITVGAWYGGRGAAFLALALSSLGFHYFFVEPTHSLSFSAADLPYLLFFTAFALVVSWFSAARRRAERELSQANEKLQIEIIERLQQASLLNLTHDTIFVRDMSEVITYWNQGAQELYGWAAEEAIGKRARDLLSTTFPAPFEQIRAEVLETGRWEGELKRTKADGTEVIVATRWSLKRGERGEPVAIMETSNNITEHKRREEEVRGLNTELARRSAELEVKNKELEAFAYSISHDLRAPLRHMSGYAQMLQKQSSSTLDQKSQRYMQMILESAKRMGHLIDDLLAFSRIGRTETQKTLLSLDQLVKEALSEVRQDTVRRNIAWKFGALPEFYGDRSMLRLAFVNLLSNAIKFTRTRPRAEIEIGSADGGKSDVVVFVKDNGVGFDMKYAHKLFGVFQRLHHSDTFEGTGIGLATVQRIIHRHGGRVWAEGLVDGGATFYFSVPKETGHS